MVTVYANELSRPKRRRRRKRERSKLLLDTMKEELCTNNIRKELRKRLTEDDHDDLKEKVNVKKQIKSKRFD